MTALKKGTLLFLFIIGILTNFALFTVYQPNAFLSFKFLRLEEYTYVGFWMPYVLFYMSGLLIIILIFGIIILLFTPIKEKVLLNKSKNAETIIEMKAIKSLVLLELDKVDFIENKKVKISIFKSKKKIKGSITGSVVPYYELDMNSEELLYKIISSTSKMFGISENAIQLKLNLKPMKVNKNNKLVNKRVK